MKKVGAYEYERRLDEDRVVVVRRVARGKWIVEKYTGESMTSYSDFLPNKEAALRLAK